MIDIALARRIRIVGLDVDGVLTDGGIYLGEVAGAAMEFKRFDIQDGIGVSFLRAAGIRVAIVTGRVSEAVRRRGAELRVDDVVQDPRARKLPAFEALLDRYGIGMDEAAFVGDDLPDLGIMRAVGLPVAVGNATAEVRGVARLQLDRTGGRGAVREFAERLLRARGEWDALVEQYVVELARPLADVPG